MKAQQRSEKIKKISSSLSLFPPDLQGKLVHFVARQFTPSHIIMKFVGVFDISYIPSKFLNVYNFGMKMHTYQPITAQLVFQEDL